MFGGLFKPKKDNTMAKKAKKKVEEVEVPEMETPPENTKESLLAEGYVFLKHKGAQDVYAKNGKRVRIDRD